ncbi:hypothetical protein BDR06DRAFT_1002154 [Suillus hirtellus]|nr:hypothetical protein BDR06DRAFT_1002154 [Suillus hirtellus]
MTPILWPLNHHKHPSHLLLHRTLTPPHLKPPAKGHMSKKLMNTNDTHPPATEPPQAPILSAPAPNVNTTAPETTTKRAHVKEINEDEISNDDKCEDAWMNPKFCCKKAAKAQEDVDEDVILADIDVQPIINESSTLSYPVFRTYVR